MTRLSYNALADFSNTANIELPRYQPADIKIGIVHIGPGAFHRGHQAVYTDNILNQGGPNWGICEVSINSPDVRDKLSGQDNLYTLAILDKQVRYRVIGAIKEVLVAPEKPQKVIERIASADVKVVTLTITEKGYLLNANNELDVNSEIIQYDLQHLDKPKSAIGYIVAGLKQRFECGIAPCSIICCDNLNNNGQTLRSAVIAFCEVAFCNEVSASLTRWISESVPFPCTMVDSITPATTDELHAQVANKTGLKDSWPIQREAYCQWVIEDVSDRYPNVNIPWINVGATLSKDISSFELAKLRILNGTHTSLAMLGILMGIESVEQAIKTRELYRFIESMLHEEIIPTLPDIEGFDLTRYSYDVLKRYENPNICHHLAQIAWDSSQKIPIRILSTIADCLKQGIEPRRLCQAFSAWMHFISDHASENSRITDPLAERLCELGSLCNDNPNEYLRFFDLPGVVPETLSKNQTFKNLVKETYFSLLSKRGQAVNALLASY